MNQNENQNKVRLKLVRHRWPDEIAREKKKKRRKALHAAIVIAALLIGYQVRPILERVTTPSSVATQVNRFETVYRDLLNSWYFARDLEHPEKELADNAIKGMIEKNGDTHTSYMTQDEMNELNQNINMNFDGIGVQYYAGEGANVVTRVFKDSPAEKAGIHVGDIFTHVNGTDISKESSENIRALILGKSGTQVKVDVLRGTTPISFELIRSPINALAWGEILPGNIGYLEISSFGKELASITQSYFETFNAQNVEKIIIDLRDNGGGYLQSIENISRLFFKNDDIVYRQDFMNESEVVYRTNNSVAEQYPFKNIVVLINEKSASASEVLTLALRENLNATVVGVKSYGKGTVQTQHEYHDDSALKVTIAKWNAPSGLNIHGVGIEPDVTMKLADIFYTPFIKLDDEVVHYDSVHGVVSYVQKALDFLGYHQGRTDGYYDSATRDALFNYKKNIGLPIDDQIDASLQDTIYSSVVKEWSQNKKEKDLQLNKAIEVLNDDK